MVNAGRQGDQIRCIGVTITVADPAFWKGGVLLQAAEGSRTEVRNADQSARSVEKIFAFIFQLSGWALVAPSCFAQQVPDVKGLQDPGPPCASFSCSNFAHAT